MDTGSYMSDLIERSEYIQEEFNIWLYQAVEIFCNGKKDPHDIYPLIDLAIAKTSFIDGMTSKEYSWTIDI